MRLKIWRTGALALALAFVHDNMAAESGDVIKIGGEWISSLELENALGQHPAVKEVAVVGIPDRRWEERPLAQVVLREDQVGKVTPRDLQHFLHEFIDRGAIHKRAVLTEIQFVDALPRTSVGKINKRAIRAGRIKD